MHFLTFILQNFRDVAIFRTVEIVKERSCAILSLNILMYNKIIKQTAKPVVLFQNMSSLNLLLFEVNYVLSRIKHTINIIKLTDESVCWSKYTILDLLSFYIFFLLKDSGDTCLVVF